MVDATEQRYKTIIQGVEISFVHPLTFMEEGTCIFRHGLFLRITAFGAGDC